MPSHNYDTEQRKIARDRRQYLLLNPGDDGSVSRAEIDALCVPSRRVDDCGRRGVALYIDQLGEGDDLTVSEFRQFASGGSVRFARLVELDGVRLAAYLLTVPLSRRE